MTLGVFEMTLEKREETVGPGALSDAFFHRVWCFGGLNRKRGASVQPQIYLIKPMQTKQKQGFVAGFHGLRARLLAQKEGAFSYGGQERSPSIEKAAEGSFFRSL